MSYFIRQSYNLEKIEQIVNDEIHMGAVLVGGINAVKVGEDKDGGDICLYSQAMVKP